VATGGGSGDSGGREAGAGGLASHRSSALANKGPAELRRDPSPRFFLKKKTQHTVRYINAAVVVLCTGAT